MDVVARGPDRIQAAVLTDDEGHGFHLTGTAIGQLGALPQQGWYYDMYQVTSGVEKTINVSVGSGTGYQSRPGGNPSDSGMSIGVAEGHEGPPAYAMQSFGGGCTQTPVPGDPYPLQQNSSVRTDYEQRRTKLKTNTSRNIETTECKAYFNQTEQRKGYYAKLKDGIDNQQPYDGWKTTMSRFDAGVLWQNATADDIDKAKNSPVCGLFTDEGTRAAAQAIPRQDQNPPSTAAPTAVYLNTKFPRSIAYFTPADLLHEVLHNVTGLGDRGIGRAFDIKIKDLTVVISDRLYQERCAPR